MEIRASPPPR